MVISSKKAYAIPKSVCPRALVPVADLYSTGDTQTQFWLSLCGASGFWCTQGSNPGLLENSWRKCNYHYPCFTAEDTSLSAELLIVGLFKLFSVSFYYLFIFGPCNMLCWILVPWPGIKPVPPALEVWSPNRCTAREILRLLHPWSSSCLICWLGSLLLFASNQKFPPHSCYLKVSWDFWRLYSELGMGISNSDVLIWPICFSYP